MMKPQLFNVLLVGFGIICVLIIAAAKCHSIEARNRVYADIQSRYQLPDGGFDPKGELK